MGLTSLVYAMPQGAGLPPHVVVALDQLRGLVDRLVLAVPAADVEGCAATFAAYDPTLIVPLPEPSVATLTKPR